MTFESILFEKELVLSTKPQKKYTGILVLLALFLFHSLLLTQAVVRSGANFQKEDAATIEAAYQYSRAIDSGSYSKLFKPESQGVAEFKPPVYYLSFYLPLKLFPSSPALALAAVNSFYLLLTMLFVYWMVRKGRNAPSAWFAASLTAAFPFIISMGRHASPDLALTAFVAGAYCCYINSESFEIWKWGVLFSVCFSLGLLCDTRYIIYVLPLVPFALNGILNPLTRGNAKYVCILLLLLPAPWYLRNSIFSFLSDLFVRHDFSQAAGLGAMNLMNLLHDLPLLLDSLHLPLLVVGVLSLIWLFTSVFMAYEDKEILLVWFILPYSLFSFFSRAGGGNIAPALLPFALAAGIMMPNKARKGLLVLTLLLAAGYQSGFMPSMGTSAWGRPAGLFGLPLVRSSDLKNEEVLKAISASAGDRAVKIEVVGEDQYFNPDSLKLLAKNLGYGKMVFVRYSKDYMGLVDFVVYKTASFSTPYQSGIFKEYSDEITAPGGWFSSVFQQLASFDRPDTAKLLVYSKRADTPEILAPGTHTFAKFSIGSVVFEDAITEVGPFDKARNSYEFFEVFIPHLEFHGADLYSIKFRLEGLSILPLAADFSQLRLTGCDSLRIVSLKVQEATLNSLLKTGSSYFQNLQVKLDNGLSVLGSYHNIGLNLGFSVAPAGAGVKLKLTRASFGAMAVRTADESQGIPDDEDEDEGDIGQLQQPPVPDTGPAKGGAKDYSQYAGDKTVSEIFKVAGYEKLINRAEELKKGNAASAVHKPRPPARAVSQGSGSLLSFVLVKLFSMNYELLDERALPFKLKINKIYIRNGLLTIR